MGRTRVKRKRRIDGDRRPKSSSSKHRDGEAPSKENERERRILSTKNWDSSRRFSTRGGSKELDTRNGGDSVDADTIADTVEDTIEKEEEAYRDSGQGEQIISRISPRGVMDMNFNEDMYVSTSIDVPSCSERHDADSDGLDGFDVYQEPSEEGRDEGPEEEGREEGAIRVARTPCLMPPKPESVAKYDSKLTERIAIPRRQSQLQRMRSRRSFSTSIDNIESETGVYVGKSKGTYPQGRGVYEWPDGSKYEGDWLNGKPEGEGRFEYACGAIYVGEWKGGLFDGLGTLLYPYGACYEGSFDQGVKSGHGKMLFVTGDAYRGFFAVDKMEGDGVYQWADGVTDVSCFSFDKRVGRGMRCSSDKKTGWPLVDGELEDNPSGMDTPLDIPLDGEMFDILLDEGLSNGEFVFFRALCGCAKQSLTETAEGEAYEITTAELQQPDTELAGACECGAMNIVIASARDGAVSVQRLGLFQKWKQILVLESFGIRTVDQLVRAAKRNGTNMAKAFYKLCAIEEEEKLAELEFDVSTELL